MKVHLQMGAVLLCCTTASWAQQSGPTRKIDVGISARLAYDSNVFGGNSTSIGGGKQGDYRLTPSLDLDVLYPLGRQAVFASGSVGYDFFRKNTRLNRERIDLRGGAQLHVARCNSVLETDFGRYQSNLDDLINSTRIINTEEHRSYSADLSCGGNFGIVPSIGYTHSDVENSDFLRSVSDIKSDTYRVSLGYTRPTFGTLSLFGNYRHGRYPNRAAFLPGSSEGIKVYSAGASYDRQIGSRLRGAVSIGLTRVDPLLSGVKKFKGLSYSGDITFIPNDRWKTALGFSRSAEQSNLFVVSYSINTSYHADIQYALSERIQLSTGGSISRRTFETSTALGLGFQPNDKTYSVNGGIGFVPRRRLRFGLDARYQQRDVDGPFLGYRGTQVAFTTRLSL